MYVHLFHPICMMHFTRCSKAPARTGHLIATAFALVFSTALFAQFTPVGQGSYTNNFPGVDAAGRNSFPSGTPLVIGAAAQRPAPTNDWWSHKIKNNHSDNLFNYPFTLKTVNAGLVVTYIPWGVIDNIEPVVVGVNGLAASAARVADFSDWTVTMDWASSGRHFQATSGIGMPFLYFTKDSTDIARVTVNSGTVTISNEMLLIANARNGADFVVYAPTGSTWNQTGTTYTSTLNGKNYWSMAFIPLTATSIPAVANEYKAYAYVFPTDTRTTWDYNEATSVVTTDFEVVTEVKEGTDSVLLMGLLPHQWAHLSAASPVPDKYSYATVRGELKTMAGNHFQVANTFHGILPTLPYLNNYSPGFSPMELSQKVKLLQNEQLATWTDSYNEGQVMNRLIQTARIADQLGDTVALQRMLATVKERLEDWLKAESGEVAFLFYYQPAWKALIGYPAGHGQDGNLNDHHFHWGYFIHAASFMEQYEPGWAAQWGPMINLLVRDAASPNRNDPMFPFLRNFSPYGGHCWANGFASFPQGNDQESTSESMQFHSSLIHWGSVTGNDSIRDLGIYMYTTEQTAVEEYWFDMNDRIFGPNQAYALVSRVWGNSYDNGTFWTSDIAASYGIEMYPIHGGSLYLGQDSSYVKRLWDEIKVNTGILTNQANPNLWHDVKWMYLSFIDPEKAIEMYDSYPDRSLKFGISDAQTYHWLHSINVLGRVDATRTANHALAAAFRKGSDITYVAHNYGDTAIAVTFSDGYVLSVPAHTLATSKDLPIKGVLSASFPQAYPGGSVDLTVAVTGGTPDKVEFLDGNVVLGELTQPPYVWKAGGLTVGKHNFFAKIYQGNLFAVSNLTEVIVGEQIPYSGQPVNLPGVVQPGHYDLFEGGPGQEVAYSDVTRENSGDFRTTEYVDARLHPTEGATIGWIAAGEWLEYTVNVQQAGLYSFTFRYACGNNAGGGPLRLESDGKLVAGNIKVNSSGGWNTWASKVVGSVPLKRGKQVLRIYFEQGELNLGRLSFNYSAPLPYSQPVAHAGTHVLTLLPADTANLNGSASFDPANGPLTYTWTQVYGPSVLTVSDPAVAQPTVSGLEEGVYLMRLKVDNGTYSDEDEVHVISSLTTNVPPKVAILSPVAGAVFIEEDVVQIAATASDLIGTVRKVEFFAGNVLLGADSVAPYQYDWTPGIGSFDLTAIATDDSGSSTPSAPVSITVNEAPSCRGRAFNNHYEYLFSPADNNPTITFIPAVPGAGSPTCILYYGTDAGNMPGYNVTPNVPYQINAPKGTRIYFYYTYSYPGLGEQNTASQKGTYVVGSCKLTPLDKLWEPGAMQCYPNPVTQKLLVSMPAVPDLLEVYDLSGKRVAQRIPSSATEEFDLSILPAGMYLVRAIDGNRAQVVRIIKQ